MRTGGWLVIGTSWGVVIGVVMHDIPLGLALGAGFGALIAISVAVVRRRSRDGD